VAPLLNNPAICAAIFPHLPESSERTPEEIQAIVRTPQFSAALVSLSTALESGQLGPLLRQFGLGPNAGNGKFIFICLEVWLLYNVPKTLCFCTERCNALYFFDRSGRVLEFNSGTGQEGQEIAFYTHEIINMAQLKDNASILMIIYI
jgi:hypothetical protein